MDFRPGREGVFRNTGDCQYVLRFESCWLAYRLAGQFPGKTSSSLRFRAWRHLDVYNDHLLGLPSPAWPEALDAVEDYETSAATEETIVVEVDGKQYRIHTARMQVRTCWRPGNLPGGVIRCLGHHYSSTATGQCLTDEQMRCEQS